MNRAALAILFTALLIAGVVATPRSLQSDKAADAAEHLRMLEELEQVHQLRERMLQEAGTYASSGHGAPAPAPSGNDGYATPGMPSNEGAYATSGSET